MVKIPTILMALLLALSVSILSCDSDGASSSEQRSVHYPVEHPTEENLIPKSELTFSAAGLQTELVSNLFASQALQTIGDREGNRNYMFGRIIAADFVGESGILALDLQYGKPRLFDSGTGDLLGDMTSAGRGPGELLSPTDMYVSGQTVVIADRINGVIIFELDGTSVSSSDQLLPRFSVNSACLLDDHLVVGGLEHGMLNTIHTYQLPSKEKRTSFHEGYQSSSPLSRVSLSQNKITCNHQTKTIILVSPALPYVYGYGVDGELKWVSEIGDFHPIQHTEDIGSNGRPQMQVSFNPNGITDIYTQLIDMHNSQYALLQIRRNERQGGQLINAERRTYRIDTETGLIALISTELPTIRAVQGGQLLTSEADDVPVLRIYNSSFSQSLAP